MVVRLLRCALGVPQHLKSLQALGLSFNALRGPVPPGIYNWTSIQQLTLYDRCCVHHVCLQLTAGAF